MNHSLANHAQQRIDNGASPDDLAHLIEQGDDFHVSTPLTQAEYAKGGYTARYYTLAYIASGAIDDAIIHEAASIEAAELVGPNAHEYDYLVEAISERMHAALV